MGWVEGTFQGTSPTLPCAGTSSPAQGSSFSSDRARSLPRQLRASVCVSPRQEALPHHSGIRFSPQPPQDSATQRSKQTARKGILTCARSCPLPSLPPRTHHHLRRAGLPQREGKGSSGTDPACASQCPLTDKLETRSSGSYMTPNLCHLKSSSRSLSRFDTQEARGHGS